MSYLVLRRAIAVATLISASASLSGPSWAQSLPSANDFAVIARAVGALPSRSVVQYVAQNAKPVQFDAQTSPQFQNITTRQMIRSICGSVQDGYVAELIRANRLQNIDLDASLGDSAYTLQWPACLNVEVKTGDAQTYTVKSGDTFSEILRRFTGAVEAVKARSFFGAIAAQSSDKNLRPGTTLKVPFVTQATSLVPTIEPTAFASGLTAIAKGDVAATPDPQPPGEIIGPVHFVAANTPVGSIQGGFQPCEAGDGSKAYPFDAAEVVAAYNLTRDQYWRALSPVTVVVIDNGFFGAPCAADGTCPATDGDEVRTNDRFPSMFFDFDDYKQEGGFGPSLSATGIWPLNYWNKSPNGTLFSAADVTDDTGHGTHVTGLVLGGPYFQSQRSAFLSNKKPWLTLVIVNIAAGRPTLAAGVDRNLSAFLSPIDGSKIVNMSVAFNGKIDPQIKGNVENALDRDTLFVVAAGNDGGNLSQSKYEYYPARFGGEKGRNVITVASIDGPVARISHLSSFSNYGSEYVDIAAPGCKIESWVDADHPAREISGTSQATPLVTFTASLLKSVWLANPSQIKNRIFYSGDLLDVPAERKEIRSQSQLDIAKTLTYMWDRVTYERNGQMWTILGHLPELQGLSCDDVGEVNWSDVRAVKRDQAGHFVIYRNEEDSIATCGGTWDDAAQITFDTRQFELLNGQYVNPQAPEDPIRPGEIIEIVKAD